VYDRSGTTKLASGSVVTLDNEIDQSTGTVRIKAVFDNKDHALFPSQFVNVQILADVQRGQIVIPAAAVQQGPQGAFVYVVRDGKASMGPVTVGLIEAERASIAQGLDVGDVVVTNGIDRLRDGARVEVGR
jgi:multidrug efflux system membrane fusion protein